MGKPKIRFEGYSEDWEQRKFGEIVEKYEDPVETPTEGYTRLGIRSHAKGTFHSYVEKGKELETAKMFRVAADKFIVNITFGWEHAVAITDENDAGKLVSHRFPQYSFNAGMDPKFFRYLILDENFKHHLELSSPGGAGRNRVLKLSDMLEYKMIFPSEAEQRKIATYFDDLDHLITLHQRKCEETKTLKKYMLQKMFPQNGHSVPEIRFSGFTEDWEQRKVCNITTSYSGGTPKSGSTEYYDGDIPFIRSGEIYSDKTELFITELGMKNSSAKMVHEGDILYALYGATSGEVSRAKLDGAINQAILAIIPNDDINANFLVEWFRKEKDKITDTYLQGGQGNLSAQIIKELEVTIPSYDEQNKIGLYFEQLNTLITLHQRKCDELRSVKKFMLQNMFI